MSLHIQFLTLSLMAVSGVLLGVGFDIIGVLTKEFSLRRWTTSLLDLGYWIFSTFFVFQVLVYANEGQVRLFVFIGLFVGIIIYYFIFSRVVRIIFQWILELFIRILRILGRILYTVAIRPLMYVYRIMHIVAGFLLTISIFLGKFMVQCTRYVSKMIQRWF